MKSFLFLMNHKYLRNALFPNDIFAGKIDAIFILKYPFVSYDFQICFSFFLFHSMILSGDFCQEYLRVIYCTLPAVRNFILTEYAIAYFGFFDPF